VHLDEAIFDGNLLPIAEDGKIGLATYPIFKLIHFQQLVFDLYTNQSSLGL